MDEAVSWAIRAVSPGLVLLVIGAAFSLRKARSGLTSRWGIRLSVLGSSLALLVPGALILIETIGGRLLWPAAIMGIVTIALGFGFFAVLRQNWAPRATDSN